jgi:hypothetical protein
MTRARKRLHYWLGLALIALDNLMAGRRSAKLLPVLEKVFRRSKVSSGSTRPNILSTWSSRILGRSGDVR